MQAEIQQFVGLKRRYFGYVKIELTRSQFRLELCSKSKLQCNFVLENNAQS